MSCAACGNRDNQADPINKDSLLMWGYVVHGTTQGLLCWYCNKVFANLYRVKYKDVKTWTKCMGENKELHDEMLSYRQQAVDQCMQAGRHSHVKVSFTQKVDLKKSKEMELEDPEDHIYELEHYKSLFGDPLSNGLGHKVTQLPGETKTSVIVPSAPVRKLRRRVKLSAEMSTNVAEGEQMQFGEDTSTKIQNDLFASFDLSHGIGASLDSLLSGQAQQATRLPVVATASLSTRVPQDSSTKGTPPKGESPPPAAAPADNGLGAFALGPCNLGPMLASAAEPRAEPSKMDVRPSKKHRAKPKPARQPDPAPSTQPSLSGKKGRPGMDLVLVTKSHVEAETQLVKMQRNNSIDFVNFNRCLTFKLNWPLWL